MPPGFVEDIIVLTPGASSYVLWASSSSSAAPYTPITAGQYAFRARLRDPVSGRACVYSRPAFVAVN
jgi:hypothetical protein